MATTKSFMRDLHHSFVPGDSPEIVSSEGEAFASESSSAPALADARLRARARMLPRSWRQIRKEGHRPALASRWKQVERTISQACRELRKSGAERADLRTGVQALLDNSTLVRMALRETRAAILAPSRLALVETPEGCLVPKAFSVVEAYLKAVDFHIDRQTLTLFLNVLQESHPLEYSEIWMLQSFAQLALLERTTQITAQLLEHSSFGSDIKRRLEDTLQLTLFYLQQTLSIDWKALFDEVSVVDEILRRDPQGAYSRMDLESRHTYCKAVAELAGRSRFSEKDVAERAVALASGPHAATSERAAERKAHIGYYLLDKGKTSLRASIDYRPTPIGRLQETVRSHPGIFYFSALILGTVAILYSFFTIVGIHPVRAVEVALLLFPAVECAVAATNLLATSMIQPQRLPRLDFSAGIPLKYATLVVVPALVTSEEQVKKAVKDLEIRYLANSDRNLHFALLTDLPDSVAPFDDKDILAGLCSSLIAELNARYAGKGQKPFFHLHRHRVFNYSEGIWMGWERKRGKLLDLNNLLLNESDNFPVKVGDLSCLRTVRYVITLDLDTQLPRDSARKLVGALAHPLNRAVVDPNTNTVVDGYGILQPRIGISINSATRSRLASLFSMDTGFDIYTRAVSDVYQDLFGEGIFTGKGIYEIETFQKVLEQRFPCNVVLSHDLIEGLHARTGLMSDVELIDDYPSHVSAYTRRRHRWVRGDWQIIFWLFPAVPNYFGRFVANPLSLLSRWKIVDNLRRSLTDFVSFLVLVSGWLLVSSHSLEWTLGVLAIIAFPGYLQLAVSSLRAIRMAFTSSFWKNAASEFSRFHAQLFLRLTLLCYQGLVTVDAVVRTLVRLTITHKRLLQWETAAQSEVARHGGKDTLESYLTWTPLIASAIAVLVLLVQPSSLWSAMPLLVLWVLSPRVSDWLNRPVRLSRFAAQSADRNFLRHAALRTWRFFAEFSGEDENWLIPDVVHEGRDVIAHRVSTTNLGLLLNARLAAWDFGFLTLDELAETTRKTFETIGRMPTCDGNLYNWYDTRTLEPLSPRFVSTVDNGNLVCCLWTLRQGLLEARKTPLFTDTLWQGLADQLAVFEESLNPRKYGHLLAGIQDLKKATKVLAQSVSPAAAAIHSFLDKAISLQSALSTCSMAGDEQWWAGSISAHLDNIRLLLETFAPWVLPPFVNNAHLVSLLSPAGLESLNLGSVSLETAPSIYESLRKVLPFLKGNGTKSLVLLDPEAESFLSRIEEAERACDALIRRIAGLEAQASELAAAQDFAALYDPKRKLLSIGYDAEKHSLHNCHYDLLASEARAAAFVGVAKGEIPPESWFELKRPFHTLRCKNALLSWSGTMFEYLLPFLWMKPYPNTVLDQSARAAVHIQREFGRSKSIPWGISESSCSERNPDGHFRYQAFGVQELAFDHLNPDDLVVSPYSSFLSLAIDEGPAVHNLRTLESIGLVGAYGFYEACDFTQSRIGPTTSNIAVKCWMAHHQAMSLLAAANAICGTPMQRRFHAEPMVAATERLLHEKFPRFISPLKGESSETLLGAPAHLLPLDMLRAPDLWVPARHTALPPNS